MLQELGFKKIALTEKLLGRAGQIAFKKGKMNQAIKFEVGANKALFREIGKKDPNFIKALKQALKDVGV